MYISDLDELSLDRDEDGLPVVQQIDKAVLSSGAWPVVLISYRERERGGEGFGEVKYSLFKLRGLGDGFKIESRLNIGGKEVAGRLASVLAEWLGSKERSTATPGEDGGFTKGEKKT